MGEDFLECSNGEENTDLQIFYTRALLISMIVLAASTDQYFP
jgi:hypothetical protein